MNKTETTFLKVCEELENLDKTFLIKGVPEEYKEIWVPNNEIKLWQIPRTSGQILKAFVLSNKSKTVLELGTSAGYSTIWLASAASQFNGKVYTIELAKPKIEMAKRYFKKAELENYIEQIEGKISEVLNKWDKDLDLIFLDADKPNYFNYIKQFEPFLKIGSIIIADNASDFGHLMKDYLEYVTNNPKYYSFLLDIDHGLMISIRL
ncbi:MAG: class I SAM-dependent methyltransferase [Nanoarchaeota archaeon]|nr:class I SAM-dependent methyltransferase [Nanoarchaeota archaeon]